MSSLHLDASLFFTSYSLYTTCVQPRKVACSSGHVLKDMYLKSKTKKLTSFPCFSAWLLLTILDQLVVLAIQKFIVLNDITNNVHMFDNFFKTIAMVSPLGGVYWGDTLEELSCEQA